MHQQNLSKSVDSELPLRMSTRVFFKHWYRRGGKILVLLALAYVSLTRTQLSHPNTFQRLPFRTLDAHQNLTALDGFPHWISDYFDYHQQQVSVLTESNWQEHRFLVLRCLASDFCGGASDRLQVAPAALRVS